MHECFNDNIVFVLIGRETDAQQISIKGVRIFFVDHMCGYTEDFA